MMKALLNIISVVIVFLMLFSSLQAQSVMSMHSVAGYSNTSESARISARIIIVQKVTQNNPLDFGIIFPDGSNSQIEISPAGKLKVSGEVALKKNSSSPATFHISSDNSVTCNVLLPTTPSTLTSQKSSKTLTVSDWSTEFNSNQGDIAYNEEMQGIKLGATLYMGNKKENPAGLYEGTYAITFLYD